MPYTLPKPTEKGECLRSLDYFHKRFTSFPDVKIKEKEEILKWILDITGVHEIAEEVIENIDWLKTLLLTIEKTDDEYHQLADRACCVLINLAATATGAKTILDGEGTIVKCCLKHILARKGCVADASCMLLCNVSRWSLTVNQIVKHLTDEIVGNLVDVFCEKSQNCHLDFLAPFFSNITQLREGIDLLRKYIYRLTQYTTCMTSTNRRGGIIAMLRNFSFYDDMHAWILNPAGVDLLPKLLLPLAGPEEFTDEDNDKLPIELQFLPLTKKRDPDPIIRVMLLEALMQLCCTTPARIYLRKMNTYVVLRELHKVEENKDVLRACENVVDILIRTEEEIGVDNLKLLNIPNDLEDRFKIMDLNDLEAD